METLDHKLKSRQQIKAVWMSDVFDVPADRPTSELRMEQPDCWLSDVWERPVLL